MSLAPLRVSVPPSDGLILKGARTAVLAHQYPDIRDSSANVGFHHIESDGVRL